MDAPTGPLWSQKQAIAYEVALEAINDVIAGYSEQIALEQTHPAIRSEEHTSELQSLMRISYAVFCLKKKKQNNTENALDYPNGNTGHHIRHQHHTYTLND